MDEDRTQNEAPISEVPAAVEPAPKKRGALSWILRAVASGILFVSLPFLFAFVTFMGDFSAVSTELGFLGGGFFLIAMVALYILAHVLIWTCLNKRARTVTLVLIAVLGLLVGGNYLYGKNRSSLPPGYDRNTAEQMAPKPDWGIDPEVYLPYTSENIVYLNEPSTLVFSPDDELPRMDAAVALLPMMSSFATACYPQEATTIEWNWSAPDYDYDKVYDQNGFPTTTLQFNNSDMGFNMLARGVSDVFFGLEPSSDQVEFAQEQGIEFEYTPIALEAFVFLVNEENPVEGLTQDQIRAIYSGQVTDWTDFTGESAGRRKIIAYQRNQGSGSQTTMERFMEGYALTDAPAELYISSMGGLVKDVADYDNGINAIGYSFRYYASELIGNYPVRLLAIDGAEPTTANIASGAYPITENFYAVTRAGELEAGRAQLAADPNANSREANLARLIDWICSDQGQYIIEQSGYTRAY